MSNPSQEPEVQPIEPQRNAVLEAARSTLVRQRRADTLVLAWMSQNLGRLLGHTVDDAISQPDWRTAHLHPDEREEEIRPKGSVSPLLESLEANPDSPGLLETANVTLDDGYARVHSEIQAGVFVMLSIGDTGDGMNAETRAHIFEPFFTTKEVGKGTGLHGVLSAAIQFIRKSFNADALLRKVREALDEP